MFLSFETGFVEKFYVKKMQQIVSLDWVVEIWSPADRPFLSPVRPHPPARPFASPPPPPCRPPTPLIPAVGGTAGRRGWEGWGWGRVEGRPWGGSGGVAGEGGKERASRHGPPPRGQVARGVRNSVDTIDTVLKGFRNTVDTIDAILKAPKKSTLLLTLLKKVKGTF